jgi:hypothetical protein
MNLQYMVLIYHSHTEHRAARAIQQCHSNATATALLHHK